MSFFSGYRFFVCLFILLIPAVVIGLMGKKLRYYRLLLTAFFIWWVYGGSPSQLLYLLIYAAGSVLLVKSYLFLRTKYNRNRYIYGCAVASALLPLVIYKVSGLWGGNIFGFLGISYICFRVIQTVIETYDGVIKEINEVTFISFILFFPTLSSGPIDRSRRFAEDDETALSPAEYRELLGSGLYKLVLGMFYKIVCSAVFYTVLTHFFENRYTPLYVAGYAYVYGFYMFFDFAGYSAMAVGTSYILGIRMPDNFNKPFLSVDMTDFWNRWHITLSSWFRDFIFTRFMMDSIRKKRFSDRLVGASVGLMLNMTVMGIWHGLEAHYIVYGIYHGVLLSVTEVYRKKSSFYRKNKNKAWYRMLSWFVTLNLVMLGFLIFSGHLKAVLHAAAAKLN